MQEYKLKENKKICKILGNIVKTLSKDKRKSLVAYESDIPRSVIHYIMEGKKDPQLTTFCRLAIGLGKKPSELMKLVEDNINNDWEI